VATVLALSLGTLLFGLALAPHPPGVRPEDIARIPAVDRLGYVARAAADVTAGCTGPALRPLAVRDHCQAQARFLLLFPECAPSCRALATQLLAP
jgi:hypothetical protein